MKVLNEISPDAVREITADELNAVSGGRMIDVFRNQRALELVAMSNAWGASVGLQGMNDTPSPR